MQDLLPLEAYLEGLVSGDRKQRQELVARQRISYKKQAESSLIAQRWFSIAHERPHNWRQVLKHMRLFFLDQAMPSLGSPGS